MSRARLNLKELRKCLEILTRDCGGSCALEVLARVNERRSPGCEQDRAMPQFDSRKGVLLLGGPSELWLRPNASFVLETFGANVALTHKEVLRTFGLTRIGSALLDRVAEVDAWLNLKIRTMHLERERRRAFFEKIEPKLREMQALQGRIWAQRSN